MRAWVLGAVLAMAAGGSALAETAQKPSVVICGRDGMTERALKREQGRVVWTTDAEVLEAVRTGRGWSEPRCISKLHHWRMSNSLEEQRRQQRADQARTRQLLASR
jgi:hypothetical protein